MDNSWEYNECTCSCLEPEYLFEMEWTHTKNYDWFSAKWLKIEQCQSVETSKSYWKWFENLIKKSAQQNKKLNKKTVNKRSAQKCSEAEKEAISSNGER